MEEEKKEEEIIDEVSIRCKVDYGWMDRWMDGRTGRWFKGCPRQRERLLPEIAMTS